MVLFCKLAAYIKSGKTCNDHLEKFVAYCGFVESNISKTLDLTRLFELQDFECG